MINSNISWYAIYMHMLENITWFIHIWLELKYSVVTGIWERKPGSALQ